MNILEILKIIFGTTIITAIAASLAIAGNFFNVRDRFKKWRSEREKAKFRIKYRENNPDFKFTLGYISNPLPNKCMLHCNVLNVSKEVKYIEALSYNFKDPSNPDKFEPPYLIANNEKWPKRLEHGERFTISTDISNILSNVAFQYWDKGVKVYCTSQSSTGDLLRSNGVDFDKLMEFLEPISGEYKKLAVLLSQKTGGSQRDIEISLWQLQFFQRLTVHITKQLQYNNIPIAEYLINEHGLIPQNDIWYHWYSDLEQKKIQPTVIEEFLKSLL